MRVYPTVACLVDAYGAAGSIRAAGPAFGGIARLIRRTHLSCTPCRFPRQTEEVTCCALQAERLLAEVEVTLEHGGTQRFGPAAHAFTPSRERCERVETR